MEVGKLNVEVRTQGGSSHAGRLRRQGRIPAVCYGPGHDPILLSVDPNELLQALDPEKRTNTVIEMTISNHPDGKVNVMLRDWQRDVLRGDLTHADFVRVDMSKDVHATVPVILIGRPEGVKLGGTLHQVMRQLDVACRPDRIPTKIEINVDHLNMGDALHVSDLKLVEGVRPLVDGGLAVCTVTAPKAEKVAEAPVEAAAEGAVAAEGAAAAPAEGAAGAKPALAGAAAPAKAAEKPAAEKKGK